MLNGSYICKWENGNISPVFKVEDGKYELYG
jgi:hypothetical protein